MSYRVEVVPRALAQLRRLDLESRLRVQGAIELLAEQPRPSRAEQIAGGTGEWRVRTGGLRVVYDLDEDSEVVRVIAVGRPIKAIPRAPRLTVPPPEPSEEAPTASPPEPLGAVPDARIGASAGLVPDGDEADHGRNWFWRRNAH